MTRQRIKHASAIYLIWIIVSAIIACAVAVWSVDAGLVEGEGIGLMTWIALIGLGMWIFYPSLCKEEKRLAEEKRGEIIAKSSEKFNCDAQKIDHPDGGFTCSILGETTGANWVWELEPYKTKILTPPPCNACMYEKKKLFGGKKKAFSCWIMGEFEVKNDIEQLEAKING